METVTLIHGQQVKVWLPDSADLAARGMELEDNGTSWVMPHPSQAGLKIRVWVHPTHCKVALTEHIGTGAGIHKFSGHLTKPEQFELLWQMAGWAAWK